MNRKFFFLLLATISAFAQQPQYSFLDFLEGTWAAEPQANGGSGLCKFSRDLQGQIIVRTNHAEYPAANGRPAVVHDDLMVIYADSSKNVHADYYDNERHVIRYDVSSVSKGLVVFISQPISGTPRYRLTYTSVSETRVSGSFEIATPDQPEKFTSYLNWFMQRAATSIRPPFPSKPPKGQ